MGSTERFFSEDDSVAERVSRRLLGTAKTEGRPAKMTRFFRLGERRADHGARVRARLATDGFPVDSPSAEVSGAEICLAMPSRKRPAGRKKDNYTLLY